MKVNNFIQDGLNMNIRKLLYLTFIPAVIWLFIICGFSGNNGESSSSLSMRITVKIADIINIDDSQLEEYNQTLEKMNYAVRKTAHMCEYAILFILLAIPLYINVVFKNINELEFWKMWMITLLLCIFFASTDEIHQLFVNGRSGKFTDVCIDTAGASIGGLFLLCIHKLSNRKIKGKGKQ